MNVPCSDQGCGPRGPGICCIAGPGITCCGIKGCAESSDVEVIVFQHSRPVAAVDDLLHLM